jgi:hypothetical protein
LRQNRPIEKLEERGLDGLLRILSVCECLCGACRDEALREDGSVAKLIFAEPFLKPLTQPIGDLPLCKGLHVQANRYIMSFYLRFVFILLKYPVTEDNRTSTDPNNYLQSP